MELGPTAGSTGAAVPGTIVGNSGGDASAAAAAAPHATAKPQLDALSLVGQSRFQSYVSSLRSWRTFVAVRRPDTFDVGELRRHAEQNFVDFQANYLTILLALCAGVLLLHPPSFFAIGVVVLCWVAYIRAGGQDPDWKPYVAGTELTVSHRLAFMMVASCVFLFLAAGDSLLVPLVLAAMLVVGHAVLHPGSVAAGDYSDIITDEL
eukprot:TRINITY_DN74021_c0_g1_i1.p1 TRINITY_DN74021_c0_g1~~TRINITY_DN74021_c0_g1_i1.p1  ORF type:complete len:227 (+),score=42.36 TRINITY_DN74021_c0_g1_i1:61-681(+)